MPASEIKSRKENRPGILPTSSPSALGPRCQGPSGRVLPTQVLDHSETRKVSQPLFGLMATGMSTGTVPADQTTPTNIRPSIEPIGTRASAQHSAEQSGIKRIRTMTPASARAIDVEDEPRRSSPRVRVVEDIEVLGGT